MSGIIAGAGTLDTMSPILRPRIDGFIRRGVLQIIFGQMNSRIVFLFLSGAQDVCSLSISAPLAYFRGQSEPKILRLVFSVSVSVLF